MKKSILIMYLIAMSTMCSCTHQGNEMNTFNSIDTQREIDIFNLVDTPTEIDIENPLKA